MYSHRSYRPAQCSGCIDPEHSFCGIDVGSGMSGRVVWCLFPVRPCRVLKRLFYGIGSHVHVVLVFSKVTATKFKKTAMEISPSDIAYHTCMQLVGKDVRPPAAPMGSPSCPQGPVVEYRHSAILALFYRRQARPPRRFTSPCSLSNLASLSAILGLTRVPQPPAPLAFSSFSSFSLSLSLSSPSLFSLSPLRARLLPAAAAAAAATYPARS